MANNYKNGWHSFKFSFSTKFDAPERDPLTLESQQLSEHLLRHIDELSYGGYLTVVDYDELDQN